MNERDSSERFEQAWEERKRGVRAASRMTCPIPHSQALETADRLARADYSSESQVRESLRQQLLYQENPEKPGKKSASRVLWGSLRFAAGAAFILFMVAGFAWSIRNLIPSSGTGGQPALPAERAGSGNGRDQRHAYPQLRRCRSPFSLPTSAAYHPAAHQGISYVVQAGDTLTSIAYKFGVSLESLLQLNGLSIDSTIYVGQILTIGASQPVAVQPGNRTG